MAWREDAMKDLGDAGTAKDETRAIPEGYCVTCSGVWLSRTEAIGAHVDSAHEFKGATA